MANITCIDNVKAETDDDIVIGGVLQARTIFSMHRENSCVIYLAKPVRSWPNSCVLRAFAGSGVDFTVGVPDRLVPRMAADPSAAAAWERANLLPHLPATSITAVTVGNEVLSGTDAAMLRSLLPAMESLHAALAACNLTSRVSVTTAHSLAVLSSSFPPSAAAFRREVLPYMSPLLGFLARTGAPFLVNAYPYFAYKADPDRVDLGYALFEPNAAGVADAATGLRYDNMLHAMVDAARAAICRANYAICSEQGEEQAAAVRGKLGGGVRVDRISSAVHQGAPRDGRLISRGACNQEQEGNRDTRVIQVQAVGTT
ncbi:glucan endo-1,3-beta-glucosidase 11-like [Miscanthus floridulus]|uniref:glucan endo-1,3-beta-glucosidase 11-like n=1 Tax=Miscanthus floridulus TaxID=154761 RepID=UPI00345AC265